MNRRMLLGLALVALALLAPLSIVSVAFAQSTAVQCLGPVTNSVICSYTSSSNTTDGSPGTAAAQTLVNATLQTALVQAQPVKMRVVGFVGSTQSSAGTWTVATSWGGNSLTLFNALTETTGLVNAPFEIECDLLAVTPASTTSPLAKELVCNITYVVSGTAAAGTTSTSSRQRTTFTLSSTPTQAVTVTSTRSTTATGSGVVVQRVTWSQGN